jgi:SAM-dependent methyltransferase
MLDVGCGTGVLLEKALALGIDARGIDAADGMVAAARARIGEERVRQLAMEELDESGTVDAVVSLSWTLNYVRREGDLSQVLARLRGVLRSGGLLIAQIAHAANTDGEWMEDVEPGPGGANDVWFRYRFLAGAGDVLTASYQYRCASLGEELTEEHVLRVADSRRVAALAAEAGFESICLLNSWREEPFSGSACPLLVAWAP